MAKKSNESIFPAESALFFERTHPGTREQVKTYAQLKNMLSDCVIEVVFMRRRLRTSFTEIGRSKPWRRMLCTADWKFLGNNKKYTGFKPPRTNKLRSKKWYEKKNLLITFDLIRRDWRMISADEYFVVSFMKMDSTEKVEEFKKFFDELKKKKSERQLLMLFDS